MEIVESIQFLKVGKNPLDISKYHTVDSQLYIQLQEVMNISISSMIGINNNITPGSPLASAHIHDVLMQK